MINMKENHQWILFCHIKNNILVSWNVLLDIYAEVNVRVEIMFETRESYV